MHLYKEARLDTIKTGHFFFKDISFYLFAYCFMTVSSGSLTLDGEPCSRLPKTL